MNGIFSQKATEGTKVLAFVFFAAFGLTGCINPGESYGTKVRLAGPNGTLVESTRPIFKEGSNVTGDTVTTVAASGAITRTVTTPRDGAGNIVFAETPILNKDRTAVIGVVRTPMVARVDTSGAIDSWANLGRKLFSGLNNMIGSVFMGMTGLEAAKQTGNVGVAAAEAVKP